MVLVITIVPIAFLTYNNDKVLTSDKDDQLKDKIHDVSALVEQVYNSKMAADQMEAIKLSQDPRMLPAIIEGNNSRVKQIVDEYSRKGQTNYIITVVDEQGIVIARSANNQSGDRTTNRLIYDALKGRGTSITDVLDSQVIESNNLSAQVNATQMSDGLAIINTEPIKNADGEIIGAVSISEVLNNNNEIVDYITEETNAYCSIFQNDTRIATTLMDSNNNKIIGTRVLPEISHEVLYNGKTVEGIYPINNLTLYTHYEPLRNADNVTVGMLFVGYNVEPGLQRLYHMQEQAIITALAASIIFISIGYIMVRTITRPIKRIVTIANSIAAGNLETPVETGASGGEIGELSVAIKQMVSYMVTNIKERINYNESILKGISDPMLVVDNEDRITFFNEPASSLTGFTQQEAIGQSLFNVLYSDREIHLRDIIRKKDVVRGFEMILRQRTGGKAIVRGSSSPIKDANGNDIGTIILLHDITKEREADEKIKASLREKEVLLKEIHHRVKNNLQIISSLLNLQSGYIKDKQSLGMFKESQNRVRSMALIHEKLYQSKDIARIDFAEYIKNLTGNLIRSYGTGAPVRLKINADSVSLGIDTAIPCGLIINEIVTNALKYAFPDNRVGEIRIELTQVEIDDNDNGHYRLVIADNGVGLPEGFDIRKTTSLGLQIVTTLTDQIKGHIEVKNGNGTEFIITFQDAKSKGRQGQ
ncbi:histidine kinase dimerization/phosphoacceptor domain -containing protein [Methanocella arvoryzae]|uniref:histidine kinase dimerization/phosphoacceptor domain -containing protein n=1 Tax=Methanocella arvoryzae TaxID=1175445 RepID=UPI0003215A77|nr:histidine kinase dimerization/phosphoacceptor domain -containing protein [Methanocella arvoryzae]